MKPNSATATVADINARRRRREDSEKTSGEASERDAGTLAEILLDDCRDLVCRRLNEALPRALDAADDALFDLADKAESSTLQSRYFEAMRGLRLKRGILVEMYDGELRAAIDARFRAIVATEPQSSSLFDSALGEGSSGLTLVENDELEESIAVANMASRLGDSCHEEIFALDRRMAVLLDNPGIEGSDNPFGPEVLCEAASALTRALDTEIEIRLVVLKLLERHLIRATEQAYAQVNALLVRNEILPRIRSEVVVTPSRGGGMAPSHEAGDAEQENVAPGQQWTGNGSGQQWAGQGAGGPAGGWPGAGGNPHVGGGGAADAFAPGATGPGGTGMTVGGASRSVTGSELLTVLQQIMRHDGGQGVLGANAGAFQSANAVGRSQVVDELTVLQRGLIGDYGTDGDTLDLGGIALGDANVLRQIKGSDAVSGLADVDGMMIDVVAMMFDFILEDDNVTNSVRVLIGRLQIPVLKVAILDKSFFARKTHPARQLLNKLAEAGMGWQHDDEREGEFLGQLDYLVQGLIDEFEDDVGVFASALARLQEIAAQEHEEVERECWQTARAAEERERLLEAKRRAREVTRSQLEGTELPGVLVDFIEQDWAHLLGTRLFREGDEGEAWHDGVDTLQDLIWSVTVEVDHDARKRLGRMLPFLLQRLKLGMDELAMGEAKRKAFFTALSSIHLVSIRAPDASTDGQGVAPEADASDDAKKNVDGTSAALAEIFAPVSPCEAALAKMREGIERANRDVCATAERRVQCRGMGSTVVAAKLVENRLVIGHVGDSRMYRLRAGVLEQLTEDHTYRQELVNKGFCTIEEAEKRVSSNVITRAIGADDAVRPEVQAQDVEPGDVYLACSDGLSDMVSPELISAVLASHLDDLAATTRMLVEKANAAGGKDNVTVALLRIPDAGSSADADAAPPTLAMAAATDPGLKRAHNEDAVAIDPEAGVLVLADGVGGHNAGEVASTMSVHIILDALDARMAAVDGERGRNIPGSEQASDTRSESGAGPVSPLESDGAATQAPLDDNGDIETSPGPAPSEGHADASADEGEATQPDAEGPLIPATGSEATRSDADEPPIPPAESEATQPDAEGPLIPAIESASPEEGVETDDITEPAATKSQDTFDFGALDTVFWEEAVKAAPESPASIEPAQTSASTLMDLDDLSDLGDVEEIEISSEPARPQLDAETDRHLADVLRLRPNAWVEFIAENGTASRARLARISKDRTRFLFTDRRGAKVSESSAHGLALELRLGRLRLIDDVPLFERTISRLTASLRTSTLELDGSATDGETPSEQKAMAIDAQA